MTELSSNGVVSFEVVDRVAWVKFNRPEKRNSMSPTLNRDMMDVLDRLHVQDERILRAHYSRGFTYLGGILQYAGMDAPGVKEAATSMFRRMKESIVMADPQLSPGNKALYRKLVGLPPQHVSPLPYLGSLVHEGAYSVKNTGVKNTFYSVMSYFKYKDVRSGR